MEFRIFFRIVLGAEIKFLYSINLVAASATLSLPDAITGNQGWLLHYNDHQTPMLGLARLEFTRIMQAERLVFTATQALNVIQLVFEDEGTRNVMQDLEQFSTESRAQIQANPDSKEWVLQGLVNRGLTPKSYEPVDAVVA
jgi:hypothetical protein